MKELEKTKRISIAAVLTILAVVIALLSYKKPKHLYSVNTNEILQKISSPDYFVTQSELNSTDYALLDIRNPFDFNKGGLENAINMPSAEILNEENSDILEDLKENGKTIVMYGNNPNEALSPFMVLSQLGYDNVKILSVENSYHQNKLITKNVVMEDSVADVNGFIKESIKKTKEAMKKAKVAAKPKYVAPKTKVVTAPKIVVPKKKKKKMPVEGGC